MPSLDKDIYQKEAAIRFCLINGLIPFLEVNVSNFRELSETSTVITDIDVLGARVDSTGRPTRVVFDCKTLGKTSPINRAFWAAGLMQFTKCNEAFIILRKKSSQAHRLSAKQVGVHLFDEQQFRNYSESCSLLFGQDYCYSSDIQNWSKLIEASTGNQALSQFVSFISSDLPLEADAVKGLRRFVAALQKVKGELNPDNVKHRSIFYFSLTVFSFLMSQIVHDLRNIVDFDADKISFEKILKYYIWGGRDSFILRDKLTKMFVNNKTDEASSEPELRAWPEFLELVRSLLDAPDDVLSCAFPLREIGFSYLAENAEHKEQHLTTLVSGNRRIRQYSMAQCKYLVAAFKLPKEFNEVLEMRLDEYKLKLMNK
jgi:hypothetical protein